MSDPNGPAVTLPAPTLDHVVVNARDRMDDAEALYRRLGFQLTPRGYHTLGSINHLAIFGTDYLELIGAPPGNARSEVLAWPHGLNGLVFGTEDSASVHAALTAAGVESSAPKEFSRPVELPGGGVQDAVFRTVGLPRELASAGRLYFCHHFTRGLVWRDEWRVHPNGVVGVAGAVIAARAPEVHAGLFRRMFGADAVPAIDGGFRLVVGLSSFDVVTPKALEALYATAAPGADGRESWMAALRLRTRSVAMAGRVLGQGGISFAEGEGRIVVPSTEAMGVTLEFIG